MSGSSQDFYLHFRIAHAYINSDNPALHQTAESSSRALYFEPPRSSQTLPKSILLELCKQSALTATQKAGILQAGQSWDIWNHVYGTRRGNLGRCDVILPPAENNLTRETWTLPLKHGWRIVETPGGAFRLLTVQLKVKRLIISVLFIDLPKFKVISWCFCLI